MSYKGGIVAEGTTEIATTGKKYARHLSGEVQQCEFLKSCKVHRKNTFLSFGIEIILILYYFTDIFSSGYMRNINNEIGILL